jgi:hypothetical protein
VTAARATQLQTTTTYNQKFPLTGKVEKIETRDAVTNVLVHRETDTWRCGRQGRTACAQGDALATPTAIAQPFLDEQLVETFDLKTGAAASHVDTVNAASAGAATSGWDNPACDTGSGIFGNLNDQLVTTLDDASGGVFVTGRTTLTKNCYDVSGAGSWWVDKLASNTVTQGIAYAAAHALPGGASAPAQTLARTCAWNANRTPASQTVQGGVVNQQSTMTWMYPATSYGLPSQVTVSAPDLPAALSPNRSTSFTYTKDGGANDGYFVLTTKNALNQITTTTHDPRDGTERKTTDPNGDGCSSPPPLNPGNCRTGAAPRSRSCARARSRAGDRPSSCR